MTAINERLMDDLGVKPLLFLCISKGQKAKMHRCIYVYSHTSLFSVVSLPGINVHDPHIIVSIP